MTRISTVDGGVIRLEVTDPAGDPIDLDDPPAAGLIDVDQDPVTPDPAVTKPAGTVGVYVATIPASHPACTQPASFTLSWTAELDGDEWVRTQDLEVIGGWPFPISELRAANTDLADPVRFPSAVLDAARAWALERVEAVTQVAWTPRRATAVLDGGDTPRILLPHREVSEVHAVTVDGVSWDPAVVTVWPSGVIEAVAGWPAGSRNITVTYTHGYETCPADVAGAVRDLAASVVVSWGSRIPDRATSVSTDVGTFRLTLPGRDGPTGLPEVDAILTRYLRPAIG